MAVKPRWETWKDPHAFQRACDPEMSFVCGSARLWSGEPRGCSVIRRSRIRAAPPPDSPMPRSALDSERIERTMSSGSDHSCVEVLSCFWPELGKRWKKAPVFLSTQHSELIGKREKHFTREDLTLIISSSYPAKCVIPAKNQSDTQAACSQTC